MTVTTNQRCCLQIWVVAKVITEIATEVAVEVAAEVFVKVDSVIVLALILIIVAVIHKESSIYFLTGVFLFLYNN